MPIVPADLQWDALKAGEAEELLTRFTRIYWQSTPPPSCSTSFRGNWSFTSDCSYALERARSFTTAGASL